MEKIVVKKTRIMPKDHWDWSMPVPFSQGWKVDNMVFVGGQISADKNGIIGIGDIETQTRVVFENIRKVLNEVGSDMKDIVKLNTYYVFSGDENEATEFWEKMTNVRMEYLSDTGPVGTAIRVEGLMWEELLIEVEAIAIIEEEK